MCPHSGVWVTCQLEAGEGALRAWEESMWGSWAHFTPPWGQLHPSEKDIRGLHSSTKESRGAGSRVQEDVDRTPGTAGPYL